MIGSTQSVTPDEESPGIEYVADEARFIIAKGQAYNVCKLSEPYDSDLEVDFYSKERIVLKGINKAQAQEIILQSVASS